MTGDHLQGLWRVAVEMRLDYLRDDVARWKLGDVIEIYGRRATATIEFAEQVLEAVSAAAEGAVASALGMGRAPGRPVDSELEFALRTAVLDRVERAVASQPPPYPRGAQAHVESCSGPPCNCFDYVEWLAQRAQDRDPDLQSGITNRALGRAERGKFPERRPADAYLRRAYAQLRTDELRQLGVTRRREVADDASLEAVAATRMLLASDGLAEALAAWLPPALSDTPALDWKAVWSDESARAWLAHDAFGSEALRLLTQRGTLLPSFVARESRIAYVAVAIGAVARHLATADIERRSVHERMLRHALTGAVGGDRGTGGHAKRLDRLLLSAMPVLDLVVGGAS